MVEAASWVGLMSPALYRNAATANQYMTKQHRARNGTSGQNSSMGMVATAWLAILMHATATWAHMIHKSDSFGITFKNKYVYRVIKSYEFPQAATLCTKCQSGMACTFAGLILYLLHKVLSNIDFKSLST